MRKLTVAALQADQKLVGYSTEVIDMDTFNEVAYEALGNRTVPRMLIYWAAWTDQSYIPGRWHYIGLGSGAAREQVNIYLAVEVLKEKFDNDTRLQIKPISHKTRYRFKDFIALR